MLTHVANENHDQVCSAAFAPDVNTLVTAGAGTRVWKLTDAGGQPALVLVKVLGSPLSRERSLAFSHDGQRIVTGGREGVCLWDTSNWNTMATFADLSGMNCVTFSPNDAYILAGGKERVSVLRSPTLELVRSQPAHTGNVASVSFARSGRQLLSAGYDFTVRSWKFDFPRPRDDSYAVDHSFSMNTVSRLTFCDRGKTSGNTLAVLTNYPSCLSLIDVVTGKSQTLSQDDSAWHICLTASGHRPQAIAIAGHGASASTGNLEIWNAASGHMIWKVPVDPQRFCCAAAFSCTGRYLASSHFRGLRFQDPSLCLWDMEKKSLVKCFSGSFASALAFSPDDQYLLLAGDNWDRGAVRVLQVDTGETIAKLLVHNELVGWICFAPSQRLFAAIDMQGGFVIWRWPSREVVLSRDRDQVSSGSGVFSPDEKLLAVACRDLVEFWRIDSGRKIGEITFPGIVSSIAFADSGDVLAVATTRGSVHLVTSDGTTQLLRDSPDSANP